MPLKPGFGVGVHQDNSVDGSLIYGVEYETSAWSGSPWDSVQDSTVPCAVCEAQLGATFIIPGYSFVFSLRKGTLNLCCLGNDTCPFGFKVEYQGFIMANYYNQYAGEYMCVDKNPVKGTGKPNYNWGR